jgi:hypothetical protein
VLKAPFPASGARAKARDMQAEGTHVPTIVHIAADVVPNPPNSLAATKIALFAKRSANCPQAVHDPVDN